MQKKLLPMSEPAARPVAQVLYCTVQGVSPTAEPHALVPFCANKRAPEHQPQAQRRP